MQFHFLNLLHERMFATATPAMMTTPPDAPMVVSFSPRNNMANTMMVFGLLVPGAVR